MDIEGEYRIAADREVVWAALNDPEMLKKCIPGCESLEKLSDTAFDARVKVVIGPVRTSFKTSISLENLNPPKSYTLNAEAKAGAAGFGRGSARVTLKQVDDATLLHYSANFTIGGKLAQVGSRLVLGATRKTADDFFGTFSSELDPEAVKLLDLTAEPVFSTGMKVGLAASTLLILLIMLMLLR
jgi:carbon monoxide dehydrogenase subunit G